MKTCRHAEQDAIRRMMEEFGRRFMDSEKKEEEDELQLQGDGDIPERG